MVLPKFGNVNSSENFEQSPLIKVPTLKGGQDEDLNNIHIK